MMTSGVMLLHDNVRSYTTARTLALLEHFSWDLFDHPITEEWEENKKKLMVIVRETYVVVSMKGGGRKVEKINPGRHLWRNAAISELLSFRRNPSLTGDLNAKHPFYHAEVINTLGEKPLELVHNSESKISDPQCPTHQAVAGNAHVLHVLFRQNV
ncbi:hypothetical protein B7P43_G00321 [Cryptotermes secundus]|uniref:Uncharacterized protein n=1 Tax=Cryptotermes secundus TaxID=105785 RepID=A0A2J7PWJ2_9NEOP|nr:hypothetical protein B7P43_G00321 [Cryptotermes secundus]